MPFLDPACKSGSSELLFELLMGPQQRCLLQRSQPKGIAHNEICGTHRASSQQPYERSITMQQLVTVLAQSSPAPWFAGMGAVFIIIALLLSVFWLWTMIDCLASSMPTGEKVLWFFVILFLHIIGSILYLLI